MRFCTLIPIFILWLSVVDIRAAATELDLYVAAMQGDLTKLEKAIAATKDLDEPHPLTNLTAWQVSRLHGRDDASDMLAKAGADTNRP
ncbi:MAG TPA: hypothetical protein VGH65_07865, partial [Verrucomicrobiaceae bacterium]